MSSERNGVSCTYCGCGLPPNNWRFVHCGDGGHVFLFYSFRSDDVRVTNNLGCSVSNNSWSFNTGQTVSATRVNVMSYIRHQYASGAYTCLNCIVRKYHLGQDRNLWIIILNEINNLLRHHGIKVETAAFDVNATF
ncbi:hypothetical protein JKP88DRAFT_263534 [Tribonema minus]|uniref:Uncharacterized protein n=1 Tax=Tribonema minus TaxID=303371 RepID=A0A835YXA4_9STRA|nr:hypothetical protein JKP88DRAFT_263534 [Tribonema minus]